MHFNTYAQAARRAGHIASLGVLALVLPYAPARAQSAPATLSISPGAATAASGQSVTFTVLLNGGDNIGGYDIFVTLDSPLVSFSPASFAFAPGSAFSDQQFSDITGGELEASAAIPRGSTQGVGPQTATPLGTFTVLDGGAPATPTLVTVGFDTDPNNNPSQVLDFAGTTNELSTTTPAQLTLTPAPEPSGLLAAAVGVAGLGALGLAGLRVRRRA